MIQLLKDRERQLVKERDELLLSIEIKYMNYIHQLLQQKLIVAETIRSQYDRWINDNNDIIYNNINNQLFNNISNVIDVQPISTTNINQADNTENITVTKTETTTDTKTEKKTDNKTDIKFETSNSINHDKEFIPNMSINSAKTLSINDKIDHRDLVGCFTAATIVDKQDTNFKIRYIGWEETWDVWSDPQIELYKFAQYESISQRSRHRLCSLKTGDFIDINPTYKHKGWKVGEIIEMDNDSGQIKVSYTLADNDGYNHFYWAHIDNKNEIEPLHTYTDFDDLTVENINDYNCVFCELTFKTYGILRKHIETDHSNTRKCICKYCPQAFTHQHGCTIHEKQHINDETYKCDLCPKLYKCKASFKLMGHLTWHYQRVHKKQTKNTGSENGKSHSVSGSDSVVAGHKRKKPSKGAKIVSKKPKRKKQKLIMNKKSNVSSFENSYYISINCHICEELFNNIEKYVEHLKKEYEKDAKRTWRHCDLGCRINKSHPLQTAKYTGIHPSTANFLQHIAYHTGEKPFKCKVKDCNKASSTKQIHEKHWIKYHKNKEKTKCKKNKNKKELGPLDYERAKGMSVLELRDEMKKRGLNFSGRKKTMLNRIKLTMENMNTNVDENVEVNTEQNIPVIPSDMPVVSRLNVKNAVDTMGNDNQQSDVETQTQTNEVDTDILSAMPLLE